MPSTLPTLSVRIHLMPANEGGRITRLLAFAELLIAESYVIKSIRVLARRDGPDRMEFVVFPAELKQRSSADVWLDIAHPVTPEARAAAITAVLDAYRKARKEQSQQPCV